MLCLQNHGNSPRLEAIADNGRDLVGQTLLDLETSRARVNGASKFRDADHTASRKVGDLGKAADRRHMMFADSFERDIPQLYRLTVRSNFVERRLRASQPDLVGSRRTTPHRHERREPVFQQGQVAKDRRRPIE